MDTKEHLNTVVLICIIDRLDSILFQVKTEFSDGIFHTNQSFNARQNKLSEIRIQNGSHSD